MDEERHDIPANDWKPRAVELDKAAKKKEELLKHNPMHQIRFWQKD